MIDKYINIGKEFIGGSGLNNAVILKKHFEIDSQLMGVIGNDINGKKILNYLKKNNFDLRKIKVFEGKTAVSHIEKIEGDYQIKKVKQGVKGKYSFNKKDILTVKDYEIVHTNIYSNTLEYLSLLKKHNELVSFDFSFKLDFDLLNNYVNYIDILFINGENNSKKEIDLLKSFDIKYIIITFGKKGFTVINGNNEIHRKPNDKIIIDSIGAGDTLISTFLAGIYYNDNLNYIVENIEYNAYQSCLKIGPFHH